MLALPSLLLLAGVQWEQPTVSTRQGLGPEDKKAYTEESSLRGDTGPVHSWKHHSQRAHRRLLDGQLSLGNDHSNTIALKLQTCPATDAWSLAAADHLDTELVRNKPSASRLTHLRAHDGTIAYERAGR